MDDTILQPSMPGDSVGQNSIPQNPQTPPAPSGGPKEMEPMPSMKNTSPEVLTPSEQPVELEPEVEKAGVKANPPIQNLSAEAKDAGLQQVKEATPVSTQPQGNVKLPMDKTQAQAIVKNKFNAGNAITWLAMLILRQFQVEEKEGSKNTV